MALIDSQFDNRTVLYLPIGIPGSGKSTYLKDFCRVNRVAYLSSDGLRAVFGKDETDQSVSGQVFATLRTMVEFYLLQNMSVVVDATNYSVKNRKDFVSIAKVYGDHVRAIVFDVPLEVCKARNRARKRVVPEDVLERMHAGFTVPTMDEVDSIIYVRD